MNNLQEEFGKIYDEYVEKIYRFVFFKINSQEIAEDLTSEVFLRGWKAFQESKEDEKKEKEIENLPAFLYQIARNVVVDFCRKNGQIKVVSAEYNDVADPHPGAEEKAALNSEIEGIRLVLSDMKDEYKEVITLRYLNDLSTTEVAGILGKSEGTVRVTLHRALKDLKSKLV